MNMGQCGRLFKEVFLFVFTMCPNLFRKGNIFIVKLVCQYKLKANIYA